MKRFYFLLLFLSLFTGLNAQHKPLKIFVYPNVSKMSRDSLLKVGRFEISDSSYEITKFTYIISGYSCENEKPRFGILFGSTFSKQMIIDIKDARSHNRSVLYVQDIYIKKRNSEDNKSIKIEYSIKIEF